MMRSAVPLLISATILSATALGSAEVDRGKLAAYLDRLASVAPRDADAHVALAKWCLEQGLAAEAREACERAVSIDTDCAAARAALGYERYGTGWRLRGSARTERAAGAPEEVPAGSASRTGAGPAPAETPREGPAIPAETAVTTPAREATAAAGGAGRIEQKKNWAAEASGKFGLPFAAYEDRDFLVHSTFSSKDREFRTLVEHLKGLRKIASGLLGLRPRTVIWPDKLHIVLLRSEPEYDRFAVSVDGVQAARNPQGSYTRGDHTVLWRPDGEGVARVVGRTLLEQLYDSGRPVGWWLRDGVAEIVVAGSPWGESRKHLERTFVDAAKALQEDAESTVIFDLLETRENRETGSPRNAALAMTLTQFLVKRSKRGFAEFVRALKSDEAPARPEDEEDLDEYRLSYASFQEKAIREHFGTTVSVLGEKWKEHVVQIGKKLEDELAREEKERQEEERRARGRGRYR